MKNIFTVLKTAGISANKMEIENMSTGEHTLLICENEHKTIVWTSDETTINDLLFCPQCGMPIWKYVKLAKIKEEKE